MAKKAILMAGGFGTRLGALTKHGICKVMLPVYDRPMIWYPLNTLVKGGITDIRIALNGRNPQLIMDFLQAGSAHRCQINYTYQAEAPDSPVQHFKCSENWIAGEDVVVMLGDSFFRFPIDFAKEAAPHIWTMPLNGMDDPSKYGQVQVQGNRVTHLVEKPKTQFSNLIQTGCWDFPSDVFDRARQLATTSQTLQFGDISQEYVKEGRMTHTSMPPESYLDLGTPTSLYAATVIIARERGIAMLAKK